jgi:hypothetical protein
MHFLRTVSLYFSLSKISTVVLQAAQAENINTNECQLWVLPAGV